MSVFCKECQNVATEAYYVMEGDVLDQQVNGGEIRVFCASECCQAPLVKVDIYGVDRKVREWLPHGYHVTSRADLNEVYVIGPDDNLKALIRLSDVVFCSDIAKSALEMQGVL